MFYCQLRFFGFLQQILILANLNKLGFIKNILEAPTIVRSSRPSPGNMQEGWQLWRKEIGPPENLPKQNCLIRPLHLDGKNH